MDVKLVPMIQIWAARNVLINGGIIIINVANLAQINTIKIILLKSVLNAIIDAVYALIGEIQTVYLARMDSIYYKDIALKFVHLDIGNLSRFLILYVNFVIKPVNNVSVLSVPIALNAYQKHIYYQQSTN